MSTTTKGASVSVYCYVGSTLAFNATVVVFAVSPQTNGAATHYTYNGDRITGLFWRPLAGDPVRWQVAANDVMKEGTLLSCRSRLNLGCSDDHRKGWVKRRHCATGRRARRPQPAPWPFEDGSVERILANDVLEHLHSKSSAMNEAHRVLRTWGRLRARGPVRHALRRPSEPGSVRRSDPSNLLDGRRYLLLRRSSGTTRKGNAAGSGPRTG
jgi:SAM-dependent methyltransferase